MNSTPLAGIWDRLPNDTSSKQSVPYSPWQDSLAVDSLGRQVTPPTQGANASSPRTPTATQPAPRFGRQPPPSSISHSPSRAAHSALPSGLPSLDVSSSRSAPFGEVAAVSTVSSSSSAERELERLSPFLQSSASLHAPSSPSGTSVLPSPSTGNKRPSLSGPPGLASATADNPEAPTQLALAEIFAGNPRPHFRSSFSHSGGSGPTSLISPRPNVAQDNARGYFSAPSNPPYPTRARSLSSAPVLDHDFSGQPVGQQARDMSRSAQQTADQYGYRPSDSSSFSSSLPVMSAPIRIGPIGSNHFSDKNGQPDALSGFEPASYSGEGSWRGAADRSRNSLQSGGMWDDREGRGRARDESRMWGDRDASVGSTGSGIGLSNMSPFARDGRHLPDIGDGTGFSGYRSRREYSLGAVGSGRKRGESVWGSARTVREDENEDNDDAFAPTRSGATSRRHSVAGPPTSRSQIGFSLPSEESNYGSPQSNSGRSLASGGLFGLGKSAIDDDDLAADLNSLHLNLEAHAAATESIDFGHSSRPVTTVGSMPSHYPQSRPFDTTAAPSLGVTFSPPKMDAFGMAQPPSSTASRFFQPPSSESRGASRFDFGTVGTKTTDSFPAKIEGSAASRPLPYAGQTVDAGHAMQQPYPTPRSPPSTFYQQLPPFAPLNLPPQTSNFSGFGQPQQRPYQGGPTPSYNQAPPNVTGPSQGHNELSNLGRGIPLHSVPADAPLYIVEFKAGRKDLFFVEDPNLQLRQGDLVIVEADRGKDIGKFYKPCSLDEVQAFQQRLVEVALGQLANPIGGAAPNSAAIARMTKEFAPKKIFGKAQASDTQMLLSKAQDEVKALALIRSKVAQKNLAMEVCDAEWQWDRRKLTFYFTLLPGHARVDFRELVRELFRIYKTRLWLCSLDQSAAAWNF